MEMLNFQFLIQDDVFVMSLLLSFYVYVCNVCCKRNVSLLLCETVLDSITVVILFEEIVLILSDSPDNADSVEN